MCEDINVSIYLLYPPIPCRVSGGVVPISSNQGFGKELHPVQVAIPPQGKTY